MDDWVSAQFDGEPLLVTMRLRAPNGTSLAIQIHNDDWRLADMRSRGWAEEPLSARVS
jgi:hypothetical protein